MPFTAAELANIQNSTLDFYIDKGTALAQERQNMPMLVAFDEAAKTFPGGKENVSLGIKSGKSGLGLTGFTHDDTVTFGNPTPTKRVQYPWKEMHQGLGLTHTELKKDGITVTEDGADQSTSQKSGREQFVLTNLLEEKLDVFMYDYDFSMDRLIHGDGSSDTKAITGIQAFILADPSLGSTGGFSRSTSWWRNRAATAAANAAGSGDNAVTSAVANGGALLQYLQQQWRQIRKHAQSRVRHRCFAGYDFLDAMEIELRANGSYSETGWKSRGSVNAGMATDSGVPFKGWNFEYDPTLDDLSLSKRAYIVDMAAICLYYMQGEKKKKVSPARPYNRFVMYNSVTTTGVMTARQLNTSMVIDIA